MKVQVKYTGFAATPSIKAHIAKRMGAIERVIQRYEEEGDLLLSIEVAKSTKHHKRGEVFYAEITIVLPGQALRAEHTDLNIFQAINKAQEMLKGRLRKYKTTHIKYSS